MMKQVNRYHPFRTLLLTALLGAALVACSKQDSEPQVPSEGIDLQLTAALGDSFGQPQDATKTPVFGSNFPAGTYTFSLAVFKADKTTVWDTGYGNIKAEVSVNAYGAQMWRFQLAGSDIWKNFLSFPTTTTGDMWFTAIYPYNASMTTAAGATLQYAIDLTSTAQQASQEDVMYAAPQKLTLASGDRSKAILLSFKHLFALFEFQIAPIFSDPCKITKIALGNSTVENWVINKGTLKSDGAFTPTTYGQVAVTDTRDMTMGKYNTYSVMIPASTPNFSTYNDGDITVYFTDGINTAFEPQPLPIKSEWLTTTSGVKAGNRYSFNMLYHNTAITGAGGMTVNSWVVNGELEDNWGIPSPADGYIDWSHPGVLRSGSFQGPIYTITDATTASYNDYATGADANNNGGYKADITAVLLELPYYRLEVAKADETSTLTWDAAWTACKAKSPAGAWRLPRGTEMMMMWLNKTELNKTPGFTEIQMNAYWSSTENSSTNSWGVALYSGSTYSYLKTITLNVRCVREL